MIWLCKMGVGEQETYLGRRPRAAAAVAEGYASEIWQQLYHGRPGSGCIDTCYLCIYIDSTDMLKIKSCIRIGEAEPRLPESD